MPFSRLLLTTASAILLSVSSLVCWAETPADLPLEPIFNGKDLSGWTPAEGPFWRVEDGVLVGENDAAEATLVQDLVDQVRLERTTDDELEAAIQIIGEAPPA